MISVSTLYYSLYPLLPVVQLSLHVKFGKKPKAYEIKYGTCTTVCKKLYLLVINYIQIFQTPQIIYNHLQTYVIYFVSFITDTVYKTAVDEFFQIYIEGSKHIVIRGLKHLYLPAKKSLIRRSEKALPALCGFLGSAF